LIGDHGWQIKVNVRKTRIWEAGAAGIACDKADWGAEPAADASPMRRAGCGVVLTGIDRREWVTKSNTSWMSDNNFCFGPEVVLDPVEDAGRGLAITIRIIPVGDLRVGVVVQQQEIGLAEDLPELAPD